MEETWRWFGDNNPISLESIKIGGATAHPAITAWTDSLANLGRTVIAVVCYNFMPVVDRTRTILRFPEKSGGFVLRFDIVDCIVYNVFVLKRPGAEADCDTGLVAEADHLDGRVDIMGVVAALLDEVTRGEAVGDTHSIPMRPDHGRLDGLEELR